MQASGRHGYAVALKADSLGTAVPCLPPVALIGDDTQLSFAMLDSEDLDHRAADAAIAEARRRWGPAGAVSVADNFPRARRLVGELRGGRFWIRGRGATWEAAFADADARTVRASRRKAAH
jgi:hypothetical protein